MRAVQVVRLDGPAAVEVREVPEPSRSPQQVLIDVAAAGVNFPDVLQSKGLYQYRPELPFTLGSEVAGTVREVPDGSPLAPGDRVVAFSGTGAFAEVVAADADAVFPLPDNVVLRGGRGPADELPHRALRAGGAGPPARRARPCSCTARQAGSARRACSWPRRSAPP